MAIETTPDVRVDASEPNEFGYREFRIGEYMFTRNEYFAYVVVADRAARHLGRRVPEGAAARRGVGLLLRDRQLRRRDRAP